MVAGEHGGRTLTYKEVQAVRQAREDINQTTGSKLEDKPTTN